MAENKFKNFNDDEENEEDVVDEEVSEEEAGPAEPEVRRSRPPRRGAPPQEGGSRGGGDGMRRPQFRSRRRGCPFCADKVKVIDWKNVDMLRRFVNDTGDMRPRRKTGTCARHQRRLAQAIKRARMIALLPYTSEHVRLTGGGRR
jgi:small subunit ribosomal protein S18